MKWFAVRTFYVYEIVKKKKSVAVPGPSGKSFYEERVVLFKAKDFSEALEKAEADAKSYQEAYENPYGEKIKVRYLLTADSFELSDKPDMGVEVYSFTEVSDKVRSLRAYLDAKLGKKLNDSLEPKLRRRFLNGSFNTVKKR